MYWNYRVVKKLMGTEEAYGIHEVYYDSQDRPIYYSENPDPCYAASLKLLGDEVERFRQALSKPVLSHEDFVSGKGKEVGRQENTLDEQ